MLDKIKEFRNRYIDKRGGKFIEVEARIMGFCVGVLMLLILRPGSGTEDGFFWGIIFVIGIIVWFLFPIVINVSGTMAWLEMLIFSFMWASVIGGLLGAMSGSGEIGCLIGIIVFCVSFFVHKMYFGISFSELFMKQDTCTYTNNEENHEHKEVVKFCPICGRRIQSIYDMCENCKSKGEQL